MPIFEYRCRDCGKLSEHLVFSGGDAPVCTTCGSANLEKLLSSFAVSTKSAGCGNGPMPGCPSGGCCGGSCGMM